MHPLTVRFLRAAYRRFVPRGVRAGLRLELEMSRYVDAPVVNGIPNVKRVVVLAPHMDDEVFGCGGTLTLLAGRGTAVRVIYLTDGKKGYDTRRIKVSSESERRDFEMRLSQTRKREAQRAAELLGLGEPLFLDRPDTGLHSDSETVTALASRLRDLRPDIVFLPCLTDPHPDHWHATGLFLDAGARAGLQPELPCWGYEVAAPLPANAVVRIDEVVELKRAAMHVFDTQAIDVNYPRVMLGLSAYRSLLLGRGEGFAEAFFVASLDVLRGIHGHMRPQSVCRASS